MTNTPVAEVNSYFATATNRTIDSGSKKQVDAQSFTQVLNETAGKSVNTAESQESAKQSQTVAKKPDRKDLDNQNAKTVKRETAEQTEKVSDGREVGDKMTAEAEKIKNAIKEELGVTEEELVQAMEMLGLSMQDLLNPESLKELMLILSGTEDSFSLLTNAELYSSMKEIMQMASDAVVEMKAEFSLTDDEFARLLEDGFSSGELSPKEQLTVDDDSQVQTDPMQKPVENEPEKMPPVVKVEVERSEETRTSDPIKTNGPTEVNEEVKGIVLPQTQEGNTGKSGAEAQNDELFGQAPQTTVTTSSVGDMVETVKEFIQSYANGEEIMRQVTEYIKVNIGVGMTSMEMQLHPESLGTINMQIASQNGVVTAQLLVQNEAVKAVLETQLVQLQETFAQQGQKVESVEVAVANYDLDRGLDQNNGEQSERQETGTRGTARRRLNLNDLDMDALDELDEGEKLAVAVMNMHGNSVDFTA